MSNKSFEKVILVGFGPHARYRYLPMLLEAKASGLFRDIVVIELDSARDRTLSSLAAAGLSPDHALFVPDRRRSGVWFSEESRALVEGFRSDNAGFVISTEPKAHAGYLDAALRVRKSCLVDKPLVLPFTADNAFAPDRYLEHFERIAALCRESGTPCTIMTQRRYSPAHMFFLRYVGTLARRLECPVTFVGIENHEGVWNSRSETALKEDHPYKYGYGMLCHSGYHFVDLLSGVLQVNRELFGSASIEVSTHAARADEVAQQIPRVDPEDRPVPPGLPWGETDLLAVGSARDRANRVQCLFSLGLFQSSVSVRSWPTLPDNVFNHNGRLSAERLRVNIGPLAAVEMSITKRPLDAVDNPDAYTRVANISVWRNAPYLKSKFHAERGLGFDPADSRINMGRARRQLLWDWLRGKTGKSAIESHHQSSRLFQDVLSSIGPRLRPA